MTNLVNKIKIPKKIRSFYYKDINFSIQDFVLNKDITNIPGNGNLIKIAFNAKYIFYTLLVIFVLFTLPILTFFSFSYLLSCRSKDCKCKKDNILFWNNSWLFMRISLNNIVY